MRFWRTPWLLAGLTALAWGSGGPACAVALRELPVPLVVAGRCGGAALVLALVLRGRIARFWAGLSSGGKGKTLLAGALLGLHFLFFVGGVAHTTLPAAVTLVALEPVAILLAGAIFFGAMPSSRQVCGIVVAIVGALCVGWGGFSADAAPALGARHSWFGDVLAVSAVFVYALYYVANRALKADAEAARGALTETEANLALAATIYAVAAVAALIGAGVALPFGGRPPATPGPQALAAVAVLALVPTLIGHTLNQVASRLLSPVWIALMSPGETFFSVLISMLVFSVYPSRTEALGGGMIALGALITAL